MSTSQENDEIGNSSKTKVIQLGFNISVSGDPYTDFQIMLDDKTKGNNPCLKDGQGSDLCQLTDSSNQEIIENRKHDVKGNERIETSDKSSYQSMEIQSKGLCTNSPAFKESSLIENIKETMDHFEKFSDHVKEIPRFKNSPVAASTPFADKYKSKSESNVTYTEFKPKRSAHLYDYNTRRRNYYKGSSRPLPADLFLRPLPGENLYRRGIVSHFVEHDQYRIYGSVDNFAKSNEIEKSIYPRRNTDENYSMESTPQSALTGILKKSDGEGSEDKQSSSSADSIKDIRIYQNGGILIMQNFKDSLDFTSNKEISDVSAKLIENCNKLKEEISSGFTCTTSKSGFGNSSDESKSSGKMVQFDLFDSVNEKQNLTYLTPQEDDALANADILDCGLNSSKNKGTSRGTPPNQDFQSLSTQENDSIVSNAPGLSPGASGKKLEWDSGADVGYLNLDLSKENLSTIERIVLKGLTSDGTCEKNVVYEKNTDDVGMSKFILERKPSDLVIEELIDGNQKVRSEAGEVDVLNNNTDNNMTEQDPNKNCAEVREEDFENGYKKGRTHGNKIKDVKKLRLTPENTKSQITEKFQAAETKRIVETIDKSVNVNTLFTDVDNPILLEPSVKNDNKQTQKQFKPSPKAKRAKKKNHKRNLTPPLKSKVDASENLATRRGERFETLDANMGIPKKLYRKVEAKPTLNEVELNAEIEEMAADQRFEKKQNSADREAQVSSQNAVESIKDGKQPVSGSSSSTNTILMCKPIKESKINCTNKSKFTDQKTQTTENNVESVGIQAFESQNSSICNTLASKIVCVEIQKSTTETCNMQSKNIQVFGLNSSLPKQLAHPKQTDSSGLQNNKSTQFFGGPVNSLPNYCAGFITKSGDLCGKVSNIPKHKKYIECEIKHMREENKENIMEVNTPPRKISHKGSQEPAVDEGKLEKNCFEKTSKKVENSCSKKEFKKTDGTFLCSDAKKEEKSRMESNPLEKEKEKIKTSVPASGAEEPKSISVGTLTSESLKEHGECIDRNLIKEKYFQSQWMHVNKGEMKSKGVSTDIVEEPGYNRDYSRETVTVACQYSSRSTEGEETCKKKERKSNDEGSQLRKKYCDGENGNENCRVSSTSADLMEREQLDSFQSTTQTASSWLQEIQDSSEKRVGKVARARSFEYLPGNVYEKSANLKGKTSSESGPNFADTSLELSKADSRNSSSNNEMAFSEGRSTLVLENSNEASPDSTRLKSLNDNLTQLNIVVTNLRRKDSKIQNITQILLGHFSKINGSGDNLTNLDATSPRQMEVVDKACSPIEIVRGTSKVSRVEDKIGKTRLESESPLETENKSLERKEGKFCEEQKDLESRIAANKENQIKWIEKEIRHLNLLRGLLEKQNSSNSQSINSNRLTTQRRGSSNTSGSQSNVASDAGHDNSKSGSPLCGSSSLQNQLSPAQENVSKTQKKCEEASNDFRRDNYGMTVCLNGSLRKVVLFPVGVQFSKQCSGLFQRGSNDYVSEQIEDRNRCFTSDSFAGSFRNGQLIWQTTSLGKSQNQSQKYENQSQDYQCDAIAQCPSTSRSPEVYPSAAVQTNLPNSERCIYCHQINCVCLMFSQSERSDESIVQWSKDINRNCYKKDIANNAYENEPLNLDKDASRTSTLDIVESDQFLSNNTPPESLDKQIQRESNSQESVGKKNNCNCDSCLKGASMNSSKPRRHSKNSCESKLYSNSEKTSDDQSRTCLCSKVEVQKTRSCNCHVIKILGPKCCSMEKKCSSCKRRKTAKKTENQYCQTDNVVIDERREIINSDIVKALRAQEIVSPYDSSISKQANHVCEGKNGAQPKCVADEKYTPDQVKVATDKRDSVTDKLLPSEKNERPRRTSANYDGVVLEKNAPQETPVRDVPSESRNSDSRHKCACKNNLKKSASKGDDHPRHYFLKIEETDVDDSLESAEKQQSLEVITVKVPVKKAGKTKLYVNNCQRRNSNSTNQYSSSKSQAKVCNCLCGDCPGKANEKRIQECNRYPKENMSDASLERNARNPCEFYETDQYNKERRNLSTFDGYPKNRTGFTGSDFRCFENRESNYSLRQGEMSSTPSDYDSHCRNDKFYNAGADAKGMEKNEGNASFQTWQKRHSKADEGFDSVQGSRYVQNQRKTNFQSDYYNYNKREYMTKSELLKEEKNKSHHRSLQEYLASNRPDFYANAESRRQIIAERAKERVKKHANRMECLMNILHRCDGNEQPKRSEDRKRIFTTPQMKEQTMKRYRNLPEVTEKVHDQKKKDEYRTNRLVADVFARKLQLEALKGDDSV